MAGLLAGIRADEMSGISPAPFAAMMLADMGAGEIVVRAPWPTPGYMKKYESAA